MSMPNSGLFSGTEGQNVFPDMRKRKYWEGVVVIAFCGTSTRRVAVCAMAVAH